MCYVDENELTNSCTNSEREVEMRDHTGCYLRGKRFPFYSCINPN